MNNPSKKKVASKSIIINELNVRSVDRGKKDIRIWKNALLEAESVINPNRARLYDIYEDALLDGHLTGIVSKRIDAVLNKDLFFENNGTVVPEMNALIKSAQFRKLIRTILETRLWGISGVEFHPGSAFHFDTIPRKHIKPELGIIAYNQSGNDGCTYEDISNIWVMGEHRDLGILLKCAPLCIYKRGGLSDWAEYIEIFGQPVRIVRYDSYDEQTRAELKNALDNTGSSLSIMIPKQADFEIKDGKQSNGNGELQMSFIKSLNDELSILILGNTDTTTSSNSSGYAQSRIHLEQQYEITKSDLAYVVTMLNSPQFKNILIGYGYPADFGQFVFSKDMDIEYLTQRIAIDNQLAQHISLPESYWLETYGINRV